MTKTKNKKMKRRKNKKTKRGGFGRLIGRPTNKAQVPPQEPVPPQAPGQEPPLPTTAVQSQEPMSASARQAPGQPQAPVPKSPNVLNFVLSMRLKEWGKAGGKKTMGMTVPITCNPGGSSIQAMGYEPNNCFAMANLAKGTMENISTSTWNTNQAMRDRVLTTYERESNKYQNILNCPPIKFSSNGETIKIDELGKYQDNWVNMFKHISQFKPSFNDNGTPSVLVSGHHNNLRGSLLKLTGYTIGGSGGTGLQNCAVIVVDINGSTVTCSLAYPGEVDQDGKWNYITSRDDFNTEQATSTKEPIEQALKSVVKGTVLPTNFKIYLMRHGDAIHNKKKSKCEKKVLDSPLTPMGSNQAEGAGRAMRYENIKLDNLLIISSPLSRCIESAGIFIKVACNTPCLDGLLSYIRTVNRLRCDKDGIGDISTNPDSKCANDICYLENELSYSNSEIKEDERKNYDEILNNIKRYKNREAFLRRPRAGGTRKYKKKENKKKTNKKRRKH